MPQTKHLQQRMRERDLTTRTTEPHRRNCHSGAKCGALQGSNKACNACNASALPQRWTTEGQPVRESCNCGAFIAAFNPREVKRWRTNHIHQGRPEPEPDRNGANAQVEHAGDRRWEINEGPDVPVVYVKAGFQAK